MKPFDQELYDSDNPAVNDWIAHLKTSGWDAIVNPDKYGVDILAKSPKGKTMCFEVEVKHNWVSKAFQFNTVHIPGRKAKFADDNTVFVVFNHQRTQAILVPGTMVKDSPTVTKKTLYTDSEPFFEIHKDYCRIITEIRH